MANEEVLGPRKTMFVLVIVVGCFAVLWPRILSPLILGHSRDQLKPNQYDREAGCCEVIFDTELAVLELLNEVCSAAMGSDGKLSPYAAAECRKSVNETCGLDIAAFLKRTDNVGKTTKMLVETMKNSNGSCLKEHFGVPVWTLSIHPALNSWTLQDTLKQERPSMRVGSTHPALRERGRAIPPGAPTPPSRGPVPLPPHIRPPPIPGMRPPLGSPGGPVPAPKSSMGFVMPIYTICIIVFFVYTLSKILFKRTGSAPYESITPDPQFRRRVFRDESRSSPETKLVVTAISGLVAEVQQQMEASYAQNQQRQDVQDNHTRPCTNGTVLGNNTVHIITSEYREESKEKSPDIHKEKEPYPEPKSEIKEFTTEPEEFSPEPVEEKELLLEYKESTLGNKGPNEESIEHEKELVIGLKEVKNEKEPSPSPKELTPELRELTSERVDLLKLTENVVEVKDENSVTKATEDFLNEAKEEQNKLTIVTTSDLDGTKQEKQSTPELLEEALREDKEDDVTEDGEIENASVKHEAEEIKSIFLETEIPQQSRVLIADFAEDRPDKPAPKHSPLVVSGKMTLSLIQDGPRESPEREPGSTLDDFTTASAVTQSAAEKEGNLSEEEVDEEIEVEEIEEEIEEEEEEEDDKEVKKIEPKEDLNNETSGDINIDVSKDINNEVSKEDEEKNLDEHIKSTEETNELEIGNVEEELIDIKEPVKEEFKEDELKDDLGDEELDGTEHLEEQKDIEEIEDKNEEELTNDEEVAAGQELEGATIKESTDDVTKDDLKSSDEPKNLELESDEEEEVELKPKKFRKKKGVKTEEQNDSDE